MNELTTTMTGLVAIIALGVAAISLIINLILYILVMKSIKMQRRLMNGNNQANIEQLLLDIRDHYDSMKSEQGQQGSTLNSIQAQLKKMKAKVGVHRYNAFASDGSDLSFTIALVDEEASGVLLTGIHSRDQTYIYAKPVEKGQSSYNLSPEEKETLTRTLR